MYSTLARVTTVSQVSSSAWWCARRPDHFRTRHTTHNAHTYNVATWVLAALARARLPTRARVRETDRHTHTTHNTSLGRPSARRRRVDANSDNRTGGFLVYFLVFSNEFYVL